MRVLLLATDLTGLGGVQLAGRLVLESLSEKYGLDLDLHCVTLNDEPTALASLMPARAFAHAARGRRLRMAWKARHALRAANWDLVVLGHLHLAPLLIGWRARRAPTLAMVYGMEAWRPLSWLRRQGLKHVNHLAYVSHHTRKVAEGFNPWLAGIRASICHLGLPPRECEWAHTTETMQAAHAMLTIGRMNSAERYKGFEELIHIWPRVRQRNPLLQLVLVGAGDDRGRLEAIAKESGDGIRFLGAVSNAERDAWLQGCRCLAMPSRGEGFGLVYLEAMRRGKAVLSGNGDAGCEVVEDGRTGRCVDPANPEALLEGVLDVAGPNAERYGNAGLDRYHERFSFAAFVDRLGAILDELVGKPQSHAHSPRYSRTHPSTGRSVNGC